MIVTPHKLTVFLICFSPVFMLISDLPGLGIINRSLIAALLILFSVSFATQKIKVSVLIQIILTILLTILMFVLDEIIPFYGYVASGSANINAKLYFVTWCFFLLYMQTNFDYFFDTLRKNLSILKAACFVWSALVAVSFLLPSSYSNTWDGFYFRSFAASEHRFASACLFIFAIAWLLAIFTQNKLYYLYILLPTIGISLCGARTYFGVIVIALAVVMYFLLNGSRWFYIIIPIAAAIAIPIILVTPIWDKFIVTFDAEGYGGFWFTFTSGRTSLWTIDLTTFWEQNILLKLFGGGGLYVYKIHVKNGLSPIWAHNDYIHVLLSNGIVGLWLYCSTLLQIVVPRIRQQRKKHKYAFWVLLLFFVVWIFNAFFNGVLFYVNALFSLPFFFYIVNYGPETLKKSNLTPDDSSLSVSSGIVADVK